jgi:hypothetical protein
MFVCLGSFLHLLGNKLYFSYLKKDNISLELIPNYNPTSILNNFSIAFEFVIHDHISLYL